MANKNFIVKNGLKVSGPVDIDSDITIRGSLNLTNASATLTGHSANVNAVIFDSAGNGDSLRQLSWNETAQTLDLGINDNVTLQIGQEQIIQVHAGEQISDGDIVYATGAHEGNLIVAAKFRANNTIEERYILGCATETIDSDANGMVTTFGMVRSIDTTGSLVGETWNDGDLLYASPATAGKLTNVEPTAPNQLVPIAFVVSADTAINGGSMFVRAGSAGLHLWEIHDVYINAQSDGQYLVWDSDNSRWTNSSTDVTTESRQAISVTDAGGDGSLTYNNGSGVLTYTGPSATEVRAHFTAGTGLEVASGQFAISDTGVTAGTYGSASLVPVFTVNAQGQIDSAGEVSVAGVSGFGFDSASGQLAIDTADGGHYYATVTLDPYTTTDLTEGSNLYYTTARADSDAKNAVSVTDAGGDGSLTYNSGTGVFTFTGPSATEVRAHFSAGTGLDYAAGVFSHTDTSSQASVDNSNGVVIQDVTLDTYGHITALGTVDLDGRYYTETEADTRFVNVTGDTMTGFLTLHAEPSSNLHAATKGYVDNVAAGLNIKEPVVAMTTDTLATLSGGSVTYNNGTSGVGATLTLGSALSTLDGVTLNNGDRVLINNEATAAHNGIYTRTSSTVFTRAVPFDEADEIDPGTFVFVQGGSTYATTGWVQTEVVSTVGTDDVVFQQFSGQGAYTAGSGITLAGTVFSHTDTSTVSNLSQNNSGNTFIQDLSLTFDTFGHVTGATASTGTVSVGDGTLTLATSGTGLSGSASFTANDTDNITFTVTSNATNTNTANAIVARDASGNFSAGTITAALSGNASTASTLQTSRTISLTGDVTGSIGFNGSANVSISSTLTAASVLSKLLTVDGAGSGLDADLLDGQQGSYYRIDVYNSAGTLLN